MTAINPACCHKHAQDGLVITSHKLRTFPWNIFRFGSQLGIHKSGKVVQLPEHFNWKLFMGEIHRKLKTRTNRNPLQNGRRIPHTRCYISTQKYCIIWSVARPGRAISFERHWLIELIGADRRPSPYMHTRTYSSSTAIYPAILPLGVPVPAPPARQQPGSNVAIKSK